MTANNILMWGHYGDCHRGICIGFDTLDENEWFSLSKPVEYTDELPIIRGNPESIYKSVALCKAIYWAYEHEWRVAEFNCEQIRRFPGKQLVEVIFGCEIPEADCLLIVYRDAL